MQENKHDIDPQTVFFRGVLDTINDNNHRTMWIRQNFRKGRKKQLQINWLMKQQQLWWMVAKFNRQEHEPLRLEIYE